MHISATLGFQETNPLIIQCRSFLGFFVLIVQIEIEKISLGKYWTKAQLNICVQGSASTVHFEAVSFLEFLFLLSIFNFPLFFPVIK